MIYYNFFVSYSQVVAGTQYTVYPYAVQSAFPFLLGIIVLVISAFSMLPGRKWKLRTSHVRLDWKKDR